LREIWNHEKFEARSWNLNLQKHKISWILVKTVTYSYNERKTKSKLDSSKQHHLNVKKTLWKSSNFLRGVLHWRNKSIHSIHAKLH